MDEVKKIKEFWSMPIESYEYHELRSHVADIEWLIEQVENKQNEISTLIKACNYLKNDFEKLQQENERYKDINQGLLEVQFSLREKEKEYQQWFEAASDNVRRKEKVIENQFNMIKELESEIEKLEEDNYDLRIESGNI